jgi:hypothetical protein
MKARRMLLAAYMIGAVLTAPAVAIGATSYEGSDYSRDYIFAGWYYMDTCDMESDSRHVYAEYQIDSGEWSEVTDGNGANNGCASRGPYSPRIKQHRTCEAIDFWPDACGSYVFP